MSNEVLELASIKLVSGRSEDDLLAASDTFQRDFLDQQEGFVGRHLVRRPDGTYLDVILWESRAHADAVFQRAQTSDVAGRYFAQMEFDPDDMEAGVEHCTVLRAFTVDG